MKSDLITEFGSRQLVDQMGSGGGGSDAIWKPSVSANGEISWTRSSSTSAPTPQNIMGPQGPQGLRGPQGEQGPQGEPGADADAKVFVAEYNVTTAQEIIAYLDAAQEPFAPMLVKRGADYYTVVTAAKQADNRVIIRTFATLSGDYYIFTYNVTNGTWSSASYGFQGKLESGASIKTVNGESLLGSGNLVMAQLRNVEYEGAIRETNINDAAGRLDLDYTPTDGTVALKATRNSVVRNVSLATADYVNEKAQFTTDGDWRYRIYSDSTFEAYYYKGGVSLAITDTSGNFYRSPLQTLPLPAGITDTYDATPLHASVNTSHNNYPCFGALASVATNQVRYYALSGSSRNTSPNYIVTAHVFGTLAAKA